MNKSMFSVEEKCDLSHLYGLQFYPDFDNKDQLPMSTNKEASLNSPRVDGLLECKVYNKLYCFLFLDENNIAYFKIGLISSVKSLSSKLKYLRQYTGSSRLFPIFFCKGTLKDERSIHSVLQDIRTDFITKFEKRKEVYIYSSENYDRIKELFETKEEFVENPFIDVHDNNSIYILLPPLSQDYLYYYYRLCYKNGNFTDKDGLWIHDDEQEIYTYCSYYSNYIEKNI